MVENLSHRMGLLHQPYGDFVLILPYLLNKQRTFLYKDKFQKNCYLSEEFGCGNKEISRENEVSIFVDFSLCRCFGKTRVNNSFFFFISNNFLFKFILQYTSAILPGVVTTTASGMPSTPAYCPPCNWSCPPLQCTCYFPGTTTVIEPRRVQPVAVPGCALCMFCIVSTQCPNPPVQCTIAMINNMIKYDSF